MDSIRWAFRVGRWSPSREQWLFAVRCIQPEEKERISRFVFQKDAKSALIGRLLLRKVIHKQLQISYQDIKLGRTDKGKPYLLNPQSTVPHFNFNVSHQGEYAVLAAEPVHQVGVDVMKIEHPRGSRTLEDFFSNMTRQFTTHEWDLIREPVEELAQLTNFYRFWCLKESYVKALGVGIGFSLQRLDFCPQTDLEPGSIHCDTRILVDDSLQSDWRFEETLIDNKHCTAVALHQTGGCQLPSEGSTFQELDFEELVEGAVPQSAADVSDWEHFSKKQPHPQSNRS